MSGIVEPNFSTDSGVVTRSPGAAKGWCNITTTGSIQGGVGYPNNYNIASITDTGTGNRTINWDTDFSSTVYSVVSGAPLDDSCTYAYFTFAVGSVRHQTMVADSVVDRSSSSVAFGDQ